MIDLLRKPFFILLWFSVYIFEKSSFISVIYYLYLHLHDRQRGFRIYRESKWCEIDRSLGFLNCWLKYILLYNLNAFTAYEFSKIYPTKIRFKNFWKGQHFKNPCRIRTHDFQICCEPTSLGDTFRKELFLILLFI